MAITGLSVVTIRPTVGKREQAARRAEAGRAASNTESTERHATPGTTGHAGQRTHTHWTQRLGSEERGARRRSEKGVSSTTEACPHPTSAPSPWINHDESKTGGHCL